MWLQILEKNFSGLQEPGDNVNNTVSSQRKSREVLPSMDFDNQTMSAAYQGLQGKRLKLVHIFLFCR